jgi:hypothetical protein
LYNRFDEAWLQREMSKYYNEADIGLTIEDLCSTVFEPMIYCTRGEHTNQYTINADLLFDGINEIYKY